MTHKKEYAVVLQGDPAALAALKLRVPRRPSLGEARVFGRAIFGDDVRVVIRSVEKSRH